MVSINVSDLSYTERKRLRVDYSRESLEPPHLLSVQLNSYRNFLYCSKINSQEQDIGLKNALDSIFPIIAHSNCAVLKYSSYSLGYSIFDVEECKIRGLTYSAPLKITVVLILYDKDSSEKIIKTKKEQEVYMGEIPLMTKKGTFVINGIEKVIVSQLHRSPGLFFEHDKGKTSGSKLLYSSRIIPYRGSWLDFEFDAKDIIFARIDRKKKFPITILLKALNLSVENILNLFFREIFFKIVNKKIILMINYSFRLGDIFLFDADIDNTFSIKMGEKFELHHIEYLKDKNIKNVEICSDNIIGNILSRNILDNNKNILVEANTKIDENIINIILENDINEFSIINSVVNKRNYIINTLNIDNTKNKYDSLIEIYKIMRPGEPSTEEAGEHLFYNLFFSPKKYNLSRVGRMNFNRRIGKYRKYKLNDSSGFVLSKSDIINVIRALIDVRDGRDNVDDIDHLGNRRVKSVGEMVDNQFRLGLSRVEKAAKERLSLAESENLMPKDLISAKPISGSIKEFFNSSQLSQFMDQNNPLSEITHKRRVSALGPGGLTRERAGFEVRDVHITHYGKVCPIETPEGPNIGLINSLAIYARINSYGFLESPYNEVVNNKVTLNVKYLSSIEEGQYVIAQANTSLDINNCLIDSLVPCRYKEEFIFFVSDNVQYIDVSPKQIVSVAAALIPFLEHNDANRALMGSNMQRQAVPLMKSEKPLIGTGIEKLVAINSGVVIIAKRSGIVDYVDASRIIIRTQSNSDFKNDVDIYTLTKYSRSNQNTCINQKSLVSIGDNIKKNDILADGPSTDFGELALGKNLLVAFMPWYGYNFEDSIIISDRLVKEDIFTSIHIEELTCISRDTKLGPEEITADIPGVRDISLSKLDDSGIVYTGAEVVSNDILVGKITPKTETQLTPEEKLLRAIFGEKASDVKDTSLRVPNGMCGIVIDVRIFTRDGTKKDNRALSIEEAEFLRIKKNLDDEYRIHENDLYKSFKNLILNEEYIDVNSISDILDINKIDSYNKEDLFNLNFKKSDIISEVFFYKNQLNKLKKKYDKRLNEKHKRLHQGDDLVPGVLKIVKVFLSLKKRIQIGDKMAGRHGNKGVISTIVPIEDMPYLLDGTPIDIILNPLGVPSRMNVGQVLETHLGLASKFLGKKLKKMFDIGCDRSVITIFLEKIYNIGNNEIEFFKKFNFNSLSDSQFYDLIKNLFNGIPMASPVFDGIKEEYIKKLLEISDMPVDGQAYLCDGRTGRLFDRKITIGYMYILKLNHLVDDKMHARSTGSYSLITQQPLGGKAQFGGQRFGEMEVWALEAYGAAYTLQEMLTVKSDDIVGRTKIYKNIVDNNHIMEAGIPESFNVLIREIRSLGLNIELEKEKK